jgi:hypothetical protein
MSKKKKQQMPLDVAKAVWEEYANIQLEMLTSKLAKAVAGKDWIAVRLLGSEMEQFKFDFNRSNK